MLCVEFCFGDISDRAVSLGAIDEVKFTNRPMIQQTDAVKEAGDYIQQGDDWVANPDRTGSIDIIIKPDPVRDADDPIRRAFYFTATRRVWMDIIRAKAGVENYPVYLNDKARATFDKFGSVVSKNSAENK